MSHPSYDWEADYRGYNSLEAMEAAREAEHHDVFLRKLAADEYWVAVRGAKALFDHTVGSAVAVHGLHSPQHCKAIDEANAKFDATIKQAQVDRERRVEELRANDDPAYDATLQAVSDAMASPDGSVPAPRVDMRVVA